MKKLICFIGVFVVFAGLLCGCSVDKASSEQEKGADNIRIVCTAFPEYDWVMNLLGDAKEHFDVTLLIQNNADIHNYQPSAQDVITMKEADLFLYIGGESDAWVQDLLVSDGTLSEHAISLLEMLGDQVLTQELIHEMLHEGSEHVHDHEHAHEHEDTLPDEHVWLSLENAKTICKYLSERLILLAPEHEKTISDNTVKYMEELRVLGEEYASMIAESAGAPLIFGDRFPFGYLAWEYDLVCRAAYTGCNAEVEVGFDTIISLAEQVDILQASYVLVIDGSDRELAKTIIRTAKTENIEILELNSMQSVSLEDIQGGATYLGIMRENLAVLQKALG